MKRQILLVSLTVCLSIAANAQTRGVKKQKYLNGAIQSMRLESADLIVLIGAGDSRPRAQSRRRVIDYNYDESGKLLEVIRYANQKAEVSQRLVFRYDDKGRLVEEARYESNGTLTERLAYRYNQDGRRSESLQYDETGKLVGRITYGYDSAGRLMEEASYKDDKPNGKALFSYDEDGRESSFIAYDAKGDIPNQISTQYDDKSNAAEKSRSGLKGSLEGRTVTTHDPKGNISVIDHFRSDGSPAWRWEYEYDDKGNVIKEKLANKVNLSVWQYSYEYDSMGNWTKRTTSQLFDDRGKLVPHLSGVLYRTFKYFSMTNAVQVIAEPEDRGIARDAALSMASSEIRPVRSGAALAQLNSPEPLGRPVASGTLEVEMTIDPEGNVEAAKVISGDGVLAQNPREVEQKIKKRTYKPVLLNGVPVRVIDKMALKFELPKPGRGKW
jgi:antitoxin component YwqK of YwqJK toxin-antitoxin module